MRWRSPCGHRSVGWAFSSKRDKKWCSGREVLDTGILEELLFFDDKTWV